MTELKPSLVHPRARAAMLAVAAAAVTATLIAVLLALAGTAPHAGAQPAEPADDAKFDREVEFVFDDRSTAETMSENPAIVWTITPDNDDCWIAGGSAERAQTIYHSAEDTDSASPDLARTQSDGTTACSYTYTLPENERGPWARWERYDRDGSNAKVPYTGSYTTTVTPCASVATNPDPCADVDGSVIARYRRAAMSRYIPQIQISVPATPADGFAGETFDVTFAQVGTTPSGCSASGGTTVTQTYTVPAGATTAEATGTIQLLVHDPDTSSGTDTCSYTATFPGPRTVTHADSSTTMLENQGAMTETIAGVDVVTRSYGEVQAQTATTFTPTVTVSVPQLVGTTPMENIWKDATFAVTIVRDAASASVTGCDDLATATTLTYTVQNDGMVPTGDTVPTVTDTTADGDACGYTVTFPAAPADDDTDDFGWTMSAPAMTEVAVNGTNTSASGAYTVGAVTFVPDATITVPANNAAKAFGVEFASTGTDCSGNPTAVTLTYTVADAAATTATADAANTALVAYPDGVTTVCEYTATVPMNETGGTTLERSTAATATVTGTSQAISATYVAAATGGPQPTTGDGVRLPPPVGTTTPAPGTAPTISASSATSSGVGGDVGDDDDADAFSGFVPSATQRVPIGVSLALPSVTFEQDATVELLVSAPGACGADMDAFGGVPAQVGLAYAVSATAGSTADVIAAGAQQLPAFAERGSQQEPCVLRVTLLSAPSGCTLSGASTDAAGRSYAETTLSADDESASLASSLVCGDEATEEA